MTPAPKAKRDSVPEKPEIYKELRENLATFCTRSVERMAEIQKRSIDIAMQQNKEAFGVWKQLAEKLPWAPQMNGLALAASTLERFAGTQKTALDAMVEQSRAFVEIMKERAAAAEKTTDSLLDFARESFDRTIDAQKKAADAALSESKSAFDKAREQFDFPGGAAVAESIQHGVDAIVEAQKELLETVTH